MCSVLATSWSCVEIRHVAAGGSDVIGRSPEWQRVLTAALRVAATDTTVFAR